MISFWKYCGAQLSEQLAGSFVRSADGKLEARTIEVGDHLGFSIFVLGFPHMIGVLLPSRRRYPKPTSVVGRTRSGTEERL